MTAAASSSSSAGISTITVTPSADIKVPPCNLCSTSFQNTETQRQHMKEPWHVYNIKRRMVSLPPISLHVFESQIQKEQEEAWEAARKSSNHSSSEDNESDDDDDASQQSFYDPVCSKSIPAEEGGVGLLLSQEKEEESNPTPPSPFNPSTCIFCSTTSPTLSQNLSHMSLSHNFHIPNQSRLTDLESFLGYVAIVVLHYHECLLCGCRKHSVQGIRQHMAAKGHAIVNLDNGSEFLEFWDHDSSLSSTSAVENVVDDDDDDDVQEIRLASGGVARSNRRHGLRRGGTREKQAQWLARRRAKATPTISGDASKAVIEGGEEDGSDGKEKKEEQDVEKEGRHHPRQPSSRSRDLVVKRRGEAGMVGVPEQQKRALAVVERNMLKREVVDGARQRWGVEKVANRQKRFKNDVPGRTNG